jgi:hypothetical protein
MGGQPFRKLPDRVISIESGFIRKARAAAASPLPACARLVNNREKTGFRSRELPEKCAADRLNEARQK